MRSYFIFFILLYSLQIEGVTQDSLFIKLDTETQLLPIYVGPIEDEQSGFNKTHLNSLEKIVRFDFEHNGMTYVTKILQRMIKFYGRILLIIQRDYRDGRDCMFCAFALKMAN